MVGSRKDMGDAGMAIGHEPENMLKIFSSPSTLPHLLSLGAVSGFLYIAMKVDCMEKIIGNKLLAIIQVLV